MPEAYAQGSTTLLSWVPWEVQPLNEVLRARSQVQPARVIRPSICLEGGWERRHFPLFSLVRNWGSQGLQGAGGHWLCGQACDH